ncbi:MAG: putative porin [Chthoniobacterales bacterium]
MFKRIAFIATAAAFAFAPIKSHGQDAGALLDLLVKKKIISDQEAEEVRAELTKSTAETAAGKWKLSTPINEIELYGDARIRYESRWGETGSPNGLDPAHDTYQRNRERYRLRIGLRGTLADDWFFGIRLETSTNPRSTNVTFGDDAGPFGKASDSINVGQAYIGYKGFKDITLVAGKMPNPFVNTLMVWDGDINPEGVAEQWKHTFNLSFGGGSSSSAGAYSKDGKNVATAAVTTEPTKMTLDVFANFAQFVYDDANPENPIGPSPRGIPNTDAWMLGWQIGAKLNFTKTTYVQVAPTIYNYTGAGDTFSRFYSGDPDIRLGKPPVRTALNQTGINDLLVYDMPMEFGWSWHDIPFRIFGDFAVNLDADDRASDAGHPDKGDERYAYQVGLGVGKIKAKHDWAIAAWWQHTEQYSLDPNLVDSDIFDSRVNMEGFAVQFGYALSDAVTANLTYAWGRQSDGDLGTGGVGDIPLNPLRRYQLFQADLNLKF